MSPLEKRAARGIGAKFGQIYQTLTGLRLDVSDVIGIPRTRKLSGCSIHLSLAVLPLSPPSQHGQHRRQFYGFDGRRLPQFSLTLYP